MIMRTKNKMEPLHMHESSKREMNLFKIIFCVLFTRSEFILRIGKTIARYGQIRIMTLLSLLSDPKWTTVYNKYLHESWDK